MKYVMLAINGKQPSENEIYVRRVLLEYKGKELGKNEEGMSTATYRGTRFIEKDGYFKDPTKSNQYEFSDGCYKLISTEYAFNKPLESVSRSYRSVDFGSDDPYFAQLAPIEFDAGSDEEAIDRFNGRDELR